MNKPHYINLIYSIFLILIGILGFLLRYLEIGDFQFTSLIPVLFGLVLIFFTIGIKNQNKLTSHIAVLITLILGVITSVMFFKNLNIEYISSRKGIIFLLIVIVSYSVLVLYILRFISISKSKISKN